MFFLLKGHESWSLTVLSGGKENCWTVLWIPRSHPRPSSDSDGLCSSSRLCLAPFSCVPPPSPRFFEAWGDRAWCHHLLLSAAPSFILTNWIFPPNTEIYIFLPGKQDLMFWLHRYTNWTWGPWRWVLPTDPSRNTVLRHKNTFLQWISCLLLFMLQ